MNMGRVKMAFVLQRPNPTSGQWSFGEKFAPGMTHILFDSLTVPYEPQGSRIEEFYRNGKIFPILYTVQLAEKKEVCIFL